MPSALEPGLRQRIVLDGDKGKDREPAFFARSLSIRDFREIVGTLTKIKNATNKVELLDTALTGVCRVICGWENMIDPQTGDEIEFSQDALQGIVTVEEAVELLSHCIRANTLSEDERKKSESQR